MSAPARAHLVPAAPAADAPGPTSRGALTSLVMLATLAFAYEFGLVLVARQGVAAEAAISLGVPLLAYLGGWLRWSSPRLLQLLAIELTFCAVVVASKVALAAGNAPAARLLAPGFFVFFVLQVAGFLVAQAGKRAWHGVFQSSVLGALVFAWWWGAPSTAATVDDAGRLLFWGGDAPLSVRVLYVVWGLNILLVETATLPRMHQAVAHLASIAISFGSGEFFHARLLTACHLFVLDLVFCYAMARPGAPPDSFAVLPPRAAAWHDAWGRPLLRWAGTIFAAAILVGRLVGRG